MKKICLKCGKEFYKPINRSRIEWESSKYCSHSCANSVNSLNNSHSVGITPWNKGKELPQYSGENNPRWERVNLNCIYCNKEFVVKNYRKDEAKYCSRKCKTNDNLGLTPLHKRIRESKSYKEWRTAVFKRDNYTCQECGIKSGNGKTIELNPHHIKAFTDYPELIFDVNNGKTLCIDCHKKTDTFGVNMWRNHKNLLALGTEV